MRTQDKLHNCGWGGPFAPTHFERWVQGSVFFSFCYDDDDDDDGDVDHVFLFLRSMMRPRRGYVQFR